MRYFCTLFDINYTIKGLVLYRSLIRHASPFTLWVLCLDDQTYNLLESLSLPGIIPISLRDFEEADVPLREAKANRSKVEYYFTCTPSLPLYTISNTPEVDVISYLDADLFFFSSIVPIYDELRDNSILIIECRYPWHLRHLNMFGIYNVGFISFRNDSIGIECLNRWRAQCNYWCFDHVESGRYADQKYLDDWPRLFPKLIVLKHKGACLAPWNVEKYIIHKRDGRVMVDSDVLIFYHFHGIELKSAHDYDTQMERYGISESPLLRPYIYDPYINELTETYNWINGISSSEFPLYRKSMRKGIPKVIT